MKDLAAVKSNKTRLDLDHYFTGWHSGIQVFRYDFDLFDINVVSMHMYTNM